MLRILMVCMGNICRSPMAEAVARTFANQAGLAKKLEFDSAGTHGYHVGEAPDMRARQVAGKRGYDLAGLRARKINDDDFSRFDLVLAMDRANLAALRRICPAEQQPKLRLFAGYAEGEGADEIPDPYYGNIDGFERVLDLCEVSARGLIASCRLELQRLSGGQQ